VLCRFNQTSSLDQVERWQLVTEAVHEKDGRIFPQLWHLNPRTTPLQLAELVDLNWLRR
jgi:2,4-dienoyl-CoA reductase-like NADH-dependent reductase (Old Yellow Enzyme family)